ncbi:MAG: class I SAM-dependent methyltransferase [Planctomycetes bacterium]|nr:class I SAM-dependent methyltransferase [Planctomycetota bacterium]
MALYNTIGRNYASFRRPDPRIAAALEAALGDAASVVNIGAGSGSYEPADREVIAVEPSEVMIRQRPADAARCVQASAESLPFESKSVDAAMTINSTHHWSDLQRGFREMARIARRRAVILTWVPDVASFWLTDEYFPEILAYDRTVFPSRDHLLEMLERTIGPVRMSPLPIPHDCTDGLLCSYWRRPELYLDPERRGAMSSFARIDAAAGVAKLRADLESGRWAERNRDLADRDSMDLGYRVITCEIGRGVAEK